MNSKLLQAATWLLISTFTGCQNTMNTTLIQYAPLADHPETEPLINIKVTEVKPGTPQLNIEGHFFDVPPAWLKKADLSNEKVTVLSPEHGKQILKQLSDRKLFNHLLAPILTDYSEQQAMIAVVTVHKYVGDYTIKEQKGLGWMLEPVERRATEGLTLMIQARADNGHVVFDKLRPRYMFVLGKRRCRASVLLSGKTRKVEWEEVVQIEATCHPEFPIKVEDGGYVLAPLKYIVHQQQANVRALASRWKVNERYSSRKWKDRLSAADRQVVVVLKVEILPWKAGSSK